MNPLLTIGIPTFERVDCVRERIEELSLHVTSEIDVLVVDNGSQDGTAEYLRSAGLKYPWLHYLVNPVNLGCDANYLRVIENSDGVFCWLLGDDTPIQPGLLPELLCFLRHQDAQVVRLSSFETNLKDAQITYVGVDDFVLHCPDFHDFQNLSGTILHSLTAQAHLRAAYRVAGLLHAYTGVQLAMLIDGARLTYCPLSILKPSEQVGSRWNSLEGHLGAWETLQRSVPPHLRHRVRRRESAARSYPILVAVAIDLLGLGQANVDRGVLHRILRLFPLTLRPLAIMTVGASHIAWLWPEASAWIALPFLSDGQRRNLLANGETEAVVRKGSTLVNALATKIRMRRSAQPSSHGRIY